MTVNREITKIKAPNKRYTTIFTIKELINHANIEMTMRYAKLAPDNGRVAIQGLYR